METVTPVEPEERARVAAALAHKEDDQGDDEEPVVVEERSAIEPEISDSKIDQANLESFARWMLYGIAAVAANRFPEPSLALVRDAAQNAAEISKDLVRSFTPGGFAQRVLAPLAVFSCVTSPFLRQVAESRAHARKVEAA